MSLFSSLPYEWLGIGVLGVLVVNTWLIVLSAWKRRRLLGDVRKKWVQVERGTVEKGLGPEGVFARRIVSQMGRALTVRGPDRIAWTDTASVSEFFGGVVLRSNAEPIVLEPTGDVELWLSDETPVRDGDFDDAWARASTNKGFSTRVTISVASGTPVWVCRSEGTLRIATLDPLAFCDRMRRMLTLFSVLSLVALASIAALACSPPLFGPVSTLGAVLGIAFFLLIQPLGVAVRDLTLLPPSRQVGGLWSRPSARTRKAAPDAIF